MGANREAFYSLLAEPVFFIILGSLVLAYRAHLFLSGIFSSFHVESALSYFVAVTGHLYFVLVLHGREQPLPVDDPKHTLI